MSMFDMKIPSLCLLWTARRTEQQGQELKDHKNHRQEQQNQNNHNRNHNHRDLNQLGWGDFARLTSHHRNQNHQNNRYHHNKDHRNKMKYKKEEKQNRALVDK